MVHVQQRAENSVNLLRYSSLLEEELADGAVVYRVSHSLLSEVAYELQPAATRAERHAAAARAVERVTRPICAVWRFMSEAPAMPWMRHGLSM